MTPGSPVTRRNFLAAAAASAALGAACRRTPAPDAGAAGVSAESAPGMPIAQVLLVDARGAGGFGAYLEELLGVEGVIGVRRVTAQSGSPDLLDSVLAAVVYGPDVPDVWSEALDRFAMRGGAVAAITPGVAFLGHFGISEVEPPPAPPDGVRLVSTDVALRLHVAARAWRAMAGDVEAAFGVGGVTISPAIVGRRHGAGVVFFWAFDVGHNVALIRQGDPHRVNVERDGLAKIRFTDLAFGWVDPDLLDRADADQYVRVLVGQLAAGGAARGPLLAADFFPGAARTVLIATGDAHGVGAEVLDQVLHRVEAAGGRLSVFYEPPQAPGWRRYARRARWAASALPLVGPVLQSRDAPPSPQLVNEWRVRGHEFSPHPTGDPDPDTGLSRAWQDFDDDGYGTAHMVVRTHEVSWHGWVDTPRAQRRHGVRMNLDAYYVGPVMRQRDGRWSHGHLIGSGLPARFVDEGGQVLDCYQQPTQVVDEQLLRAMEAAEDLTSQEAADVVSQQLNRALTGPPAALCAVFHIDSFVPAVGRAVEAGAFLDSVLRAFRSRDAPIITAGRWLSFLDGRRASAIVSRLWDADARRLTCVVQVSPLAAPGVGLLLPAAVDGRRVHDVALDGAAASLESLTRAGREWVRVVALPGAVRVDARYD